MAKLAVKDRRKVKKAEAVSGDFEPWPAGKYVGELSDVEVKVSAAGNAYWNITYTDCVNMDSESFPGRQWYTLMLPADEMPADYKPGPKAKEQDPEKAWEIYQNLVAGKIKAWFEAHGFTEDSDTDEMIGTQAVLQVGIETIQRGAKAGEKTNRVNSVKPLPEDWDGEGSGSDDGDDEF